MITEIQLKALLNKLKDAVRIIEAELEISSGEQINMGLEKSGLDLGNGEDKSAEVTVPAPVATKEPEQAQVSKVAIGYTRIEFDSILDTTEKAYQIDFGDKILWMPKSKIVLQKEGNKNLVDIDNWLYNIKFPDG